MCSPKTVGPVCQSSAFVEARSVSSASNAYTLLFSVATITTFVGLSRPEISAPDTTSGCAYTLPSTVRDASFPKWSLFTLEVLSVVSRRFAPERALSLCCVSTSTCALSRGTTKMANAKKSIGVQLRLLTEFIQKSFFKLGGRRGLGSYPEFGLVLKRGGHLGVRGQRAGAILPLIWRGFKYTKTSSYCCQPPPKDL